MDQMLKNQRIMALKVRGDNKKMAQSKTYQSEIDRKNAVKLQEVLDFLPVICKKYFEDRSTNTSSRTQLGYARDIKMFFSWLVSADDRFLEKDPHSITIDEIKLIDRDDIQDFVTYVRSDEQRANDNFAIARKMSALSSFWSYLARIYEDIKNPVSTVSYPKLHDIEIIRLEPNETAHLLDVIENSSKYFPGRQGAYLANTRERDLAIVALLLGTGIRVSECVGLNVTDVHLEECRISIRRKGGKIGMAALSDEVIEILQAYLEIRPKEIECEAFFLSLQNKRLCVQAIENMISKYVKAAGINKNITPHKLRKTFGTDLYEATSDIYLVASALGHSDVKTTTKHYARQSDKRLLEARKNIVLRGKKDED